MSLKESQFWPKWPVKITESGKIEFENKDQWDNFKIPFYGKEMTLILKKRTKDRSRQEEKFYWAVVVQMVATEMEVTRESAHHLMAEMFLTTEERAGNGTRYKRVLSTTELGDKAYRAYWEKCIHWAALPTADEGLSQDSGLNLFVPFPNESDYKDVM